MNFIRSYILTVLIISHMGSNSFSQSLPPGDELKTSAGTFEMFFIGHGSLMFRIGSFVIHVDPVSSSGTYTGLPAADLILVSHEHYDHLDENLISRLRKPGTQIFCNKASAGKIQGSVAMKAGEKIDAGLVSVEGVEAYNIVNERVPGQPFHPKHSGLGFIITAGDRRVYVAGDTENTPEMKALKNIDVAFLPMNLPYTMTPGMVADAALAFRPSVLYPYHYGDTDTSIITGLLKDSGIEVRIRDLR
jgi:L-ascorbate metabolism protein UlaG (beta-lactamase superfamily)